MTRRAVPRSQVRVIATDLDGTLLDPAGRVTPRTAAALLAAERAGLVVVFVTGRPLRWMEQLWGHVGEHGLAVCSNGAVVFDARQREVVRTRGIDADEALEVVRRIRAAVPESLFCVESVDGPGVEPGFFARRDPHREDDVVVAPVEELVAGALSGPVVKLLALRHDAEPAAYWTAVEEAVGGLVETTWSSSSALVEMSTPGVTKASTLAQLCEDLRVGPEAVVAIGDMPNDLPMLRWAGLSYAMQNAHPAVRQVADRTAPSHADDGVAQVIEGLLSP